MKTTVTILVLCLCILAASLIPSCSKKTEEKKSPLSELESFIYRTEVGECIYGEFDGNCYVHCSAGQGARFSAINCTEEVLKKLEASE